MFIGESVKMLKDTENLIEYPSMNSKIHAKIDGNHGDDSFKMGYQNAKVKNPNRSSNTLVFSSFNGKDGRANSKTCLQRLKPHIKMLQRVKFEERLIRVFMYSDYEFLCIMYGIAGAIGKIFNL